MHQFLSEMIFMSEEKLVPKLRFSGFDKEWAEYKLGGISKSITKGTTPKKYSDAGINFIKVESIENNKISKIDSFIDETTHNNELSRSILKTNDLLFSIAGSLGRTTIVTEDILPANTNQALAIIRFDENSELNLKFVQSRLNTQDISKYIFQNLAVGAQPNLNLQQVSNIKIKIPSINEQNNIQSFLDKIDRKIDLLNKKLDEYSNFKKYLMQQIFAQKLRFDFNDEWKNIPFKKLLKEVNEKTTVNNQHEILSSTKEGIFTQKDYFADRNVASKDNTGYKVLRKNQIVLSPQNLWMGNINVNTEFDIGIVSPSYKIYETTDLIDINYFKHIVKLPRLIYEYTCASEQGASIVRRNLNKQLFNEITIKVPSLNEQKKIGNLFDTCDEKIKNIDKNIQDMKEFKKGLLQQMFV